MGETFYAIALLLEPNETISYSQIVMLSSKGKVRCCKLLEQ